VEARSAKGGLGLEFPPVPQPGFEIFRTLLTGSVRGGRWGALDGAEHTAGLPGHDAQDYTDAGAWWSFFAYCRL